MIEILRIYNVIIPVVIISIVVLSEIFNFSKLTRLLCMLAFLAAGTFYAGVLVPVISVIIIFILASSNYLIAESLPIKNLLIVFIVLLVVAVFLHFFDFKLPAIYLTQLCIFSLFVIVLRQLLKK